MITILSRDTAWSHRYIVYETDGKRNVFIFPLAESFASAEARLNNKLGNTTRDGANREIPALPTGKTRRTRSSAHANDTVQSNSEAPSSRSDGGVV